MVRGMLDDARTERLVRSPKALIAPHAGYIYSGPIAASAFSSLSDDAGLIRRIVLVGPAHHLRVRGLALPRATAFRTPLGRVEIDRELVDIALEFPQVSLNDEAHAPEHCLEVELPFLQVMLEDFAVLPLLVSDAEATEIADLLEATWGGEETRVIVSSDLSHYLGYKSARATDSDTAAQILRMQRHIEEHRACGAVAINGLLEAVRRSHLVPHLLDLRNSGDTAGDRVRVVGYGAFAFVELV